MSDKKPIFISQKLFSDPTPNGRINKRIIQHFFLLSRQLTDLTEEEHHQFLGILLHLGRKLVSVWHHLNRYAAIEKKLINMLKPAKKPANPQVIELEYSQELFQEFDEFLVQLKSALDHLVKMPVPILGPKIWTLRTFGDKGRNVIKALENSLPRKYHKMVPGIRQILFEENKAWLNLVIEARDKINHFIEGGLRFEDFGVHRLHNGTIRVPMWSPDQTLSDAMVVIWDNLIRFTEDFLAMFLLFRQKPGLAIFRGPESSDPTKSPWGLSTESIMDSTANTPGWNFISDDKTDA